MENQQEKDQTLFDVIIFMYQLEIMLKNHNALMKDKILEGDVTSATIAFNNALIMANMKKIIKENPILEEYSQSEEFKERVTLLLSTIKNETKEFLN